MTSTHRERERELQRERRERHRESVRATETATSEAAVIDVARVSDATKNACLPFLFCGMFFLV